MQLLASMHHSRQQYPCIATTCDTLTAAITNTNTLFISIHHIFSQSPAAPDSVYY
jgi:hypothetical protein